MLHRAQTACLVLAAGLAAGAAPSPNPCGLQPQYLFFFAADEASPTAADAREPTAENRGILLLNAVAEGWKASPGPLLIIGHTDGAEARTVPHLDAARADAVRAALIQRGVDPAVITTRAEAFSAPMVPRPGPEAQNRYVTLIASQTGASCSHSPGTIQ